MCSPINVLRCVLTEERCPLTSYLFLSLNVALYSAFPFYFATLNEPLRAVSFYVYIAVVLTIGGLLGSVYSLPISDTTLISGGNISYAAMMMCALLLVITESSLNALRSVIRLVIVVNLFVFAVYALLWFMLEAPTAYNPFGVSSELFQSSLWVLILGEVLILTELLLILWFGERVKYVIQKPAVLAVTYVSLFMLVLCLDGILFPLIAFPLDSDLIGILIGNLSSKAVLAGLFGIPMLLYLTVFRHLVERFQRMPLRISELYATGLDLESKKERRHGALSGLNNAELRQLAERLSTANEAAGMGFWEYDHSTETIDWDDRARTIHRLHAAGEEPGFSDWWKTVDRRDRPLIDRKFQALIAGETESAALTYRLKPNAGPDRQVVHVKMQAVADRSGPTLRILGASSDVTMEHQMMDENERMQAQLHQSRKMEALGRFAGSIAHDFNNLLTPIIGHTELARAKLSADSPVASNLDEVQTAADRSRALIKQILALGSEMTPSMEALDLNDVITEFLPIIRTALGANVAISLDLKQPSTVMANRGQLEQVLLNLATNSRDAISESGNLVVSTSAIEADTELLAAHAEVVAGTYISLSVRDDGQGMDETTLNRAFEPFYTTKNVERGTGLGMYSVYTIVRHHQGYIWLESSPDSGTTVTILFPLALRSISYSSDTP